MTPASSTDLVATLSALSLLTDGQLRVVWRELVARFPDPAALADELCGRGWLTRYQSDRLLRNAGRDLVLGAYVLLEPLGGGGMGQVFKARHALMGRVVAVKLIRPELLARPAAVRRFRQEIAAAARLNHPNVITTHDAQQVGQRFFLVMEFCDGTDLAHLVGESGRLPVDRACEYARQTALGLQHIHEHRLVHRDLKPHNLLLTGATVKILDLGLARLRPEAETRTGETATGEILGTPDFLAPEQAADAKRADIRADLYSLGCTLYYLLAEQVPFPGGSLIEKLLRHRLESPIPLARLRPDVPAGVLGVVERLMAKDPADRYQTPEEAAEALALWADPGQPLPTARPAPTPLPEQLPTAAAPAAERRIGRRSVLVGLAGLGAAAGVAALSRLWPDGTGTQQDESRKDQPDGSPEPPVAGLRWRAGRTFPTPGPGEGVFAVALSADGRQLAIGCGSPTTPHTSPGPIRLLDLPAGRWELLGQHTSCSASRIAFSPNGRVVVSASGNVVEGLMTKYRGTGQVGFLSLDAERKRSYVSAMETSIHALAVLPGGGVVVAGREGQLVRLSAPDGAVQAAWKHPNGSTITALAVSADGTRVACGYHSGQLEVRQTRTLDELFTVTVPPSEVAGITGLAFRDGDRELVGTTRAGKGKPRIKTWDVPGRRVRSSVDHPGPDVLAMALAPDGRTLATGTADGRVRVWDLTDERVLLDEEGHPGGVYGLSLSGDGRTLASGGRNGTVRLWEARPQDR